MTDCDDAFGRHDDAALAIGHLEGRKVIFDLARLWRAPFNPYVVIGQQADVLKSFNLHRVTADNFAAEFVTQAFKGEGIICTKSDVPKSGLYKELLPRLCSAEVELLDDPQLVDQISALERRTRSGNDCLVDHPPGGKDDLANVVAGVCASCKRRRKIGLLFSSFQDTGDGGDGIPARRRAFVSALG